MAFCLATSAGFVKLSTNMATNVKLSDTLSCFSLNVYLYVCGGVIKSMQTCWQMNAAAVHKLTRNTLVQTKVKGVFIVIVSRLS